MTTMNSNEREQRLKQIRERWSRMNMPQTVFTSHCKGDIDFLLSLLDSQTTEDVDFEHYWDEYQRPWLPNGIAGYEHAKKAWANAATQMRERCVSKVKAIRDDWGRLTPWKEGVEAANRIVAALESLSLSESAVGVERQTEKKS